MTFTRTIIITGDNIGGNPPTLIFTFDQQKMDGIYKTYFPVVWKVSPLPATGHFATKATYKNQLLFTNPQIENGKVISPETWVEIDLGQKTDLVERDEIKFFTQPTEGTEGFIKAENQVAKRETIGVGFNEGAVLPSSALVFKDVGRLSNVIAKFTPTLSIYISSGQQKNAVLEGEIKTGVLWREDLAALNETSTWYLSRDPASGEYKIEPISLV